MFSLKTKNYGNYDVENYSYSCGKELPGVVMLVEMLNYDIVKNGKWHQRLLLIVFSIVPKDSD